MTTSVPLVVLVPVHPAEAVQEVASAEDHVSVELPPEVMLVALAESDTEGVGVVVPPPVPVPDPTGST